MNTHFQRGSLLFDQRRFEEAVGELRMHLTEDPEDARTHSLLALSLSELERYDEATAHAQRAIHLAPDVSQGHFALAHVMLDRNRYAEAQAAAEEAIRLNPFSADLFALLAALHLAQRRWRPALEAADQGLALDPEHNVCTNLRAEALVMLGDRAAAAATMGEALARRPDDALSHANQGWTLLHQGEPYKAMEHFREALRLDPEMEWARAGIVEALKARNFLYRWLLAYFLWMARLPASAQWGLIIGALVGNRVVANIAERSPDLAVYLMPLLYLYLAFVVLTWLASPLFNLLLRLDKFGRYALSKDEIRGANVLLVCLLVSLGLVAWAITSQQENAWVLTLIFALLSLPASAIFRCDEGWPRITMAAITLGLLVAALAVLPVLLLPLETMHPVLLLFSGLALLALPWALLGSQVVANLLMNVTVKK